MPAGKVCSDPNLITDMGSRVLCLRGSESTNHRCDIGSPVAALESAFPKIDFSRIDPVFPDKISPNGAYYDWSRDALLYRGQMSLKELSQRPEKIVLVVSHSDFLTQAVTGCSFANADYRVFDFVERQGPDDPYGLKEWDQTRTRGGMGWSPSRVTTLGEGVPEIAPPAEV